MDLLENILVLNPNKRLTSAEALDHDCFKCEPLPADSSEISALFQISFK